MSRGGFASLSVEVCDLDAVPETCLRATTAQLICNTALVQGMTYSDGLCAAGVA
jgi:hypothetical protein